jgi:hypothetical protein
MISVNLTGIAEVTQRLQRLGAAPMPALGEVLYEEGNRIMGQSVQLVPVDTGNLRSTSHVDRPTRAGTRVEVELSYGKHGDAPYAAVVHFTPDPPVHHPRGQSHYLQQPLFAATAGFVQRIALALQGSLR